MARIPIDLYVAIVARRAYAKPCFVAELAFVNLWGGNMVVRERFTVDRPSMS